METLRGVLGLGAVVLGLAAIGPCMLERDIVWRPSLALGGLFVLGGLGWLVAQLLLPRAPVALRHPDGSLTIAHCRLSREAGPSGLLLVFGVLPLGYSIILWTSYLFEMQKRAKPYDCYLLDAVGLALVALALASWRWETLELRLDEQGLQWNGDSWSLEQLRSYERVGSQLWPMGLEWEGAVLDLVEREIGERLAARAASAGVASSEWSE